MSRTDNRHLWIMLLCCLIPIAALTALFVLGVSLSTALLVGIFLLCPILHLWVMKSMGHTHGYDSQPDAPSVTKEQ